MSETIKQDAGPGSPDFFDIFRKTVLVGGGALANMAIGLVRNKFIAVWLGPAGIALSGIFTQLIEVVGAAFSLGLGTSGIRQIASSASSGDDQRLSRIVQTLRRTVWISGLAGAAFMLLTSGVIARLTFGESEAPKYIWPIACLGLAVLFRALYTGQGCIIRGMRRVGDYMRISVGSAFAGVLIAIPCYYWWGMAGVAVAVILGYAATLVVTWWFARRIPISNVPCSIADSRAEARLLIVFGLPIMFSGLVGTFSPYVERVILLRYLGLDAVGQYQAAFSLAGFTVTFVLAAMSADYYPKLVAHADEPERFNQEMNAQLRVALLLSIPALAWLAVLSQRATSLLYSPAFSPSGEVLRIMIIGVLGRIMAAPLRLALLAKGRGKTIFAVEVISALAGFALISFFASRLGLIGCGWAFTALHLGSGIVLAMALPALVGQSVSLSNKLLVLWSSLVLIGLWLNHALVGSAWMRVSIGLVLATGASVACLYFLTQLMGWSFLNRIRQ